MLRDFLLNLLASLAYDLLKSLPSRFQGSRDDLLRDLRDLRADIGDVTRILEALYSLLARYGAPTNIQINGDLHHSVINVGNNNQITLDDGGDLAERWQALTLDDAAAEQRYRQQTAALFSRLTFPLPGDFSFALPLEQVYFPRRIARPFQPAEEIDDALKAERPLALLNALGAGKTTTLRYLTWSYAASPPDRFFWRKDDFLPFYLPAAELARAWQPETDFVTACARAAARAPGHRVLSPWLVERLLRAALQEGRALLLIDALDEYRAEPAARRAFVESLSAHWRALPPENRLLLASRPYQFLHQDFAEYRLPDLAPQDAASLALPLARALLEQRQTPPDLRRRHLDDLRALLAAPRLAALLDRPFYVTLLTALVCRPPRFEDGLQQARQVMRLRDLYRFFLRQTIEWEKAKPAAAPPPEEALFHALADLAWQTFLPAEMQAHFPLLRPLSEVESRPALEFWQRTGLLWRDEFSLEWRFAYSGFQSFGAALALQRLWQSGQHDLLRRLQAETLPDKAWDDVWSLFYGEEEIGPA